ncbi:2OG-Fe(II) oxygenase family protein [Ningiella sp. W23]|uniref:2OG-Fe(II) oxygenase family protein n=1 Tax=Ningiella sp. W23 TaxID=3023715 RepID=UPI0037571454
MLSKQSMAWVQRGLQFHRSQHYEQALSCYQKSIEIQTDNYEALQLMGALYYKIGQLQEAISSISKSLAIQPQQAHVLNTLGNIHKKQGNELEAIANYEKSIALKPDYIDPYINLIQVLIDSQQLGEASANLHRAQKAHLFDWRLMHLEAKFYMAANDLNSAISLLKNATKQHPNIPALLHELGLAYRLNGEAKKAVVYFEQLSLTGHRSHAFHHNFANALSDINQNQQALEHYGLALQLDPFAIDTLNNCCDLMWESGQGESMFAAFENALMQNETPQTVYFAYIRKLLRTNMLEEAQKVLGKMNEANDTSQQTLHLASVALLTRAKLHYNISKEQFVEIFETSGLPLDVQGELIEFALEHNYCELAYQHLNKLLQTYPQDQMLLALLHTCSRLTPSWQYPFNNIENYVFEYTIEPPKNHSLEDYLSKLKTYLLSLHASKQQPLEQTLHNGTQTRGNLFDNDHPLLAHVKAQYRAAVKSYRETLKGLPEIYPGFWQHKETQFSGSWSVALKKSGYHNHHFHPMGWLSSALYVSLPNITNDSNQGYFQVGIPNLKNHGLGLPALKEVKPEVGKLVLFPSMLWHGTVPFEEETVRLSIACDIVYQEK